MFEVFLLIATIVYILQILLFILGIIKSNYQTNEEYEPTVTIIVAERNEEKNIGPCLESLFKLEYPKEKLEIVLVDDGSTDETLRIMQSFAKSHPHVQALQVDKQIGHLQGKANAVAFGISHSNGEIIFQTDADCIVPPTWVKEMAKYYLSNIGIVSSYTLLEESSIFEGMQSLDWAFLHTVAGAAVGIGKPLTCFGNNFSYRRDAYIQVGGYPKIKFSVTEDFALFKTIIQQTEWHCRYVIDPKTMVMSKPCASWRELVHQKKRWGRGGVDMEMMGYLIMAVAFFDHALILLAPFLVQNVPLFLFALLGKLVADFLFILRPLKILDKVHLLRYFLPFELYYIVYVVLLPFLVFFGGKVYWKGRIY